jgi:hypothetical protein
MLVLVVAHAIISLMAIRNRPPVSAKSPSILYEMGDIDMGGRVIRGFQLTAINHLHIFLLGRTLKRVSP